MFSLNLIRDYYVLHQRTLCMSILTFDEALSVWITKSILLFSDIFSQYFWGNLDGVISQLIDIKIHTICF